MDRLARLEVLVDRHVGRNDKESAVKLLFDLIVACAKEKQFDRAENLKKRLIQIDPTALAESIKAGDIIEAEKVSAIDQDHLSKCSDLYATLTTEEANTLYYSMKEGSYHGDQIIFGQGEKNSNLYFINQGQLIMIYNQGDRESVLKMLKPGDIAGEDTFFSHTLCTTSLVTFSPTKLFYLERSVLNRWKTEMPSLESKLHGYCLKLEKVSDLLKKKGLDRRTQERVSLSGKINLQVLNGSGTPVGGVFTGDLSDISVGGLSFYVKIQKKEVARLLLGRNLILEFSLPLSGTSHKVSKKASVVAVRSLASDGYSLHLKFAKMLNPKIIERLDRS